MSGDILTAYMVLSYFFRWWVGGGWLDKLKIKLSQLSTLVEVEVEAELGKKGQR